MQKQHEDLLLNIQVSLAFDSFSSEFKIKRSIVSRLFLLVEPSDAARGVLPKSSGENCFEYRENESATDRGHG